MKTLKAEDVELSNAVLGKFWRGLREDFPTVTFEQVEQSAARIKAGERNETNVVDVMLYGEIKSFVDERNGGR